MSKSYERQTGKSGVVVAARIMTGNLKDSFVMKSEGNAKGVVPENGIQYEPHETYVKAVGFIDGLPLVEAINPGDEAIGLLVSAPRGAIPTVATPWGGYKPQIGDVEFFGSKIATVPLVDGITDDIKCHDSVKLDTATEFTKSSDKNSTRVLEPRKGTDTGITKIAVLTGFTGDM